MTAPTNSAASGGQDTASGHPRASVLLAHGSSDPHWLAPFEHLLQQIHDTLGSHGTRVELAYMELAEPSLASQIRALVSDGVRHIDVLPLFFAAGRHLRRDVPAKIDELQTEFKNQDLSVVIHLHSPVGLEPEVAGAISQVVQRRLS
ncbi:MAG: cobalamin biosynthesis protein CbiX [Oceanospirillaceae bacterium]|nr:cobalamin biosynthesis protein CbiX [Oceanospirillaceae bacterium]MBT10604.1 cobalamin biosynthesis protein CbiX [Oceanospirillaceae bacterium]|tara:strand:- start:10511 stop:10951 length:441 start_codon:yes stop_codon:yes gene_type:complete